MPEYRGARSTLCCGRGQQWSQRKSSMQTLEFLRETTCWHSPASKHVLIKVQNARMEILWWKIWWWSLNSFKYKTVLVLCKVWLWILEQVNCQFSKSGGRPDYMHFTKRKIKNSSGDFHVKFEKLWCGLLVLFQARVLGPSGKLRAANQGLSAAPLGHCSWHLAAGGAPSLPVVQWPVLAYYVRENILLPSIVRIRSYSEAVIFKP